MLDQKHRYPAARSRGASSPVSRRRVSLPTSRSGERDDAVTLATVFKNSAIGLCAFVVSGLTFVTAACAAAYASKDPSALVAPLGLAALLLASFIGGFVTTKLTRSSPVLCAAVFCGIASILMLALSLCFSAASSSHYNFGQGLLMHGFALLFSILGAFTGNFKRKPNPRKRRFGN